MVNAILNAHGTAIAGLEQLHLDSVEFTSPNFLDLNYISDSFGEQAQIWVVGTSDKGDKYTLGELPVSVALDEGGLYNVRIRPVNAVGIVGPWSNVEQFGLFNSGCVLHDQKIFSVAGLASTLDLGVNLDAMTGGALSRPVGSLLVITAALRSAVNSATVPTAAPLQAGYQQIVFPVPLSGGGQPQQAVCANWKIVDGTEANVVPVIRSNLGAVNVRMSYVASVFTFIGSCELGNNIPIGQCTTANPGPKTLEISSEGTVTCLSMAMHSGTTSDPADFMNDLSGEVLSSQTTTAIVRLRHQHRIWLPATPKTNVVWDPGDYGNNACACWYFRFTP